MNPVLESLFKHKSIRKYKEQPLEDEKLQLIIKAAQAAPTWCNGEQVSIIAIKDKARKEVFQKLCWGQPYISTDRKSTRLNSSHQLVQYSSFFALIFTVLVLRLKKLEKKKKNLKNIWNVLILL